MKKIYFKGLEKALNEGCTIRVWNDSDGSPCTAVYKDIKETSGRKFASYAGGFSVVSSLLGASNNLEHEVDDYLFGYGSIKSNIDKALNSICPIALYFFKLANSQVLTTICYEINYGNPIPVKSVITEDIKTGLKTLNATLKEFKFELIKPEVDAFQDRLNNFDYFVIDQSKPVLEYQEKLKQEASNRTL